MKNIFKNVRGLMPIYEYFCKNCNYKFEELQSINNDDCNLICPKCNKNAKRIISKINGKVLLNSKENFQEIKEQAKKDSEKIKNDSHSEEIFLDYFGEEAAQKFYE